MTIIINAGMVFNIFFYNSKLMICRFKGQKQETVLGLYISDHFEIEIGTSGAKNKNTFTYVM